MSDALPERLKELLYEEVFRLPHAREIGRKIIDKMVSVKCYISLSISLKGGFPERALWGLEQFVAQKKRRQIPNDSQLELFEWLLMDGRTAGEMRHGLKAISVSDLSDEMIEKILEPCFTWLASPLAPGATRVYSMQIIARIIEHFPELEPEFFTILEHHYEDGTIWFKGQARLFHPSLANR